MGVNPQREHVREKVRVVCKSCGGTFFVVEGSLGSAIPGLPLMSTKVFNGLRNAEALEAEIAAWPVLSHESQEKEREDVEDHHEG